MLVTRQDPAIIKRTSNLMHYHYMSRLWITQKKPRQKQAFFPFLWPPISVTTESIVKKIRQNLDIFFLQLFKYLLILVHSPPLCYMVKRCILVVGKIVLHISLKCKKLVYLLDHFETQYLKAFTWAQTLMTNMQLPQPQGRLFQINPFVV